MSGYNRDGHIVRRCATCDRPGTGYEHDAPCGVCGGFLCGSCVEEVCELCDRPVCDDHALMRNGERACTECIATLALAAVVEEFEPEAA